MSGSPTEVGVEIRSDSKALDLLANLAPPALDDVVVLIASFMLASWPEKLLNIVHSDVISHRNILNERVSRLARCHKTIRLINANSVRRVSNLAVQIGRFHSVAIDNRQAAHACTCQVKSGWTSESTGAYYGNRCGFEGKLAGDPKTGQNELASVAIIFAFSKGPSPSIVEDVSVIVLSLPNVGNPVCFCVRELLAKRQQLSLSRSNSLT
ncbi:hypothetical protein SEPCBS119000_005356 [Sporothrix epigloea]|uniref:Uncharacterized protein n=1 Tax=Sporothrix epigloea TaxID=1892477 RepID=A0ABP0DX61_9PEZI